MSLFVRFYNCYSSCSLALLACVLWLGKSLCLLVWSSRSGESLVFLCCRFNGRNEKDTGQKTSLSTDVSSTQVLPQMEKSSYDAVVQDASVAECPSSASFHGDFRTGPNECLNGGLDSGAVRDVGVPLATVAEKGELGRAFSNGLKINLEKYKANFTKF